MEQLTTEMILVMAMIGVAVFLFIVEWVRVDVVAILMMVALPLLHLVTPKEAFIGLSSNAVVSIIAVIIIGAGLDKTGIINKLVNPIVRIAGSSPSRIVIAISLTVAGISSFMQNIGAAALFSPGCTTCEQDAQDPHQQTPDAHRLQRHSGRDCDACGIQPPDFAERPHHSFPSQALRPV